MTEKTLSQEFQAYFGKWFDIQTEVSPINSKDRIDLILTSHNNNSFVFGIELKKDGHKKGRESGELVKQAQRYESHIWNINGINRKIPILIAPAISNTYIQIDKNSEYIYNNKKYYAPSTHNLKNRHHNINSFIGVFNVGEVKQVYLHAERDLGYAFIYRNFLLWHEISGVHTVNYKQYYGTK